MKTWLKCAAVTALLGLVAAPYLYAPVPVIETGELLSKMQEILEHDKKNKGMNEERLEALEVWLSMLIKYPPLSDEGISEIARDMANKLPFDDVASTLKNARGTVLDSNTRGREDLEALRKIELAKKAYYTLSEDQIHVLAQLIEPPVWKAVTGGGSNIASLSSQNRNLIRKVAAKKRRAIRQSRQSDRLSALVYESARSLLPEQLLKGFDPARTTAYLLQKAGVVEIADGVTVRPAAPQDTAFEAYANLGCDGEDALLFWSDPMVVDGYHPIFGTALNQTPLKGHKQVDMDNVASRGYSGAIEKWNKIHPPEEKMANPFRGYAAQVMPGLMIMSGRGQLTPGEQPTDTQLAEAMALSKKFRLLPSQCIEDLGKTASADRVAEPLNGIRFVYPSRIVRVQGGADAALIELAKMERASFIESMRLAEKRIKEIAKLKDATLEGRRYVDQIIQKYSNVEQEAEQLAHRMDEQSAIPQITQYRRDLLASIEGYRGMLSRLEHWHDALKHREWKILQSALGDRRKAIFLLMDNAAVRWRTAEYSISEQGSI